MRKALTIVCIGAASLSAAPQLRVQEFAEDPIAYIGHGAAFDRSGNEINITPTFIEAALRYYTRVLYERSTLASRKAFDSRRAQLMSSKDVVNGQYELLASSLLIDSLVVTADVDKTGEISGKNRFLKGLMRTKLSPLNQPVSNTNKEPFALDPAFISLVGRSGLRLDSPPPDPDNAYIKQCADAGVPIPPDWGDSKWVSKGVLKNVFISKDREADVFAYASASPVGACIALPRSTGSTIELLGIICSGKESSNACFWDNQRNGQSFPITKGDAVKLTDFAGGPALLGDVGGVCTQCHAGENPFIIHPKTALGLPSLAGLQLKTSEWFKPMVDPNWPQNPGPMKEVPAGEGASSCYECHTKAGSAGRFPAPSDAKKAYCGTVLNQAIASTMPPSAPNSPDYAAHAKALLAACVGT